MLLAEPSCHYPRARLTMVTHRQGSQEREPPYSGTLGLTATHSDSCCRWAAPRSTPSDADRRTGSAWHARGLGFESP